MKRPRSPKFPAVPLRKAIQFAQTLKDNGLTTSFTPKQAIEALEFSSMHGRAVKVLAALRAYGLMDRIEDAEEQRRFSLSEKALKMTSPGFSDLPNADKILQRAALSPMLFRKLFTNAKDASEEEVAARLENRAFTPAGAARAAKVFRLNHAFAKFDSISELPSGLPERGPEPSGRPTKKAGRHMDGPRRKGLSLPLSTGMAFIPAGLTEEEHTLVLRTLNLWKDRLVGSAC